jgi:hypothetical protein
MGHSFRFIKQIQIHGMFQNITPDLMVAYFRDVPDSRRIIRHFLISGTGIRLPRRYTVPVRYRYLSISVVVPKQFLLDPDPYRYPDPIFL